ncbi:LysR family transcriptional regulator [Brevibacillus fluminis]|uniref:LysR family transcriptional regulator n=1 Tax=Brevibacillus fluminis TaxID=511487 RepID=A0A3M8DHM0_9BACL|nr:LysR family transcriptional regulator [Brevibacillus fluminis]RNB87099.1 LysR family transcriptional regulator [Brevibacillus fluminis]
MEFRQIQYFIEVAKREHMTEAAHALHVAQSAISRQIFNLETELGIDLFFRDGRNLKLTPIGKTFLNRMEQAMQVIEEARKEVEEFLDPERGVIRIGFPSSLAAHTLPSVISAFRAKHPHATFVLQQGAYRSLVDAVTKGEIDLALLGPVPTQEKQVKGEILFQERIVALLPSDHPLARTDSLRLSQLRDDSFVLFPRGYVLREFVVNACRELSFEPRVSFEGEDIDAIKGFVAAGLGVTLLPESTLFDSMPRTTVKHALSEPAISRTVGVITPTNRQLPPTAQLFYRFLQGFYSVLNRFGE